MTPDHKTTRFASLLPSFDHPLPSRGRKPSPFSTSHDGGTRFPLSRAAYTLRLHHFKLLTAVDQCGPCENPAAETSHCIGSVRRTLWLYIHDCLPDFPGKALQLADLLATHNANLLMQGIESSVLDRLGRGLVSDKDLASAILDDTRLLRFAGRWFNRSTGTRRM